jgi:hypothetical protein
MSYTQKFAEFIEMCNQAKGHRGNNIYVYEPQSLGDNYNEIVESLNRVADAEIGLRILTRRDRAQLSVSGARINIADHGNPNTA